jgi:hypothetical protein
MLYQRYGNCHRPTVHLDRGRTRRAGNHICGSVFRLPDSCSVCNRKEAGEVLVPMHRIGKQILYKRGRRHCSLHWTTRSTVDDAEGRTEQTRLSFPGVMRPRDRRRAPRFLLFHHPSGGIPHTSPRRRAPDRAFPERTDAARSPSC